MWVPNGRNPDQPIATYYDVPTTRNTPRGVFRVQIVFGRWMDVGVGFSPEEAKENAAEAVIDRMCEAKTPKIDWEKDAQKQKELLERKLLKLSIEKKEFGVESIERMMDRIEDKENWIGEFETIDMFYEIEELFAKFGLKLKSEQFEGEKEKATGLTVISEEYPPITVVEFGQEDKMNRIKALFQVLRTVKDRLGNEIQNLLLERNLKREQTGRQNKSRGNRRNGTYKK